MLVCVIMFILSIMSAPHIDFGYTSCAPPCPPNTQNTGCAPMLEHATCAGCELRSERKNRALFACFCCVQTHVSLPTSPNPCKSMLSTAVVCCFNCGAGLVLTDRCAGLYARAEGMRLRIVYSSLAVGLLL